MSVPFQVPAEFLAKLAVGSVERHGALLKDAASGRIVAHLQETGAFRGAVERGLGLAMDTASAPLSGGTGIVSVIQNEQMRRKLVGIENMLGNVQALQIGSLAVGVAGIGVTVATSVMLMRKMEGLKVAMAEIGDKVDAVAAAVHEINLERTFSKAATALQRLDEAEDRRNPEGAVAEAEKDLHSSFDEFGHAATRAAGWQDFDPDLYETLLKSLSLTAAAQAKALLTLGEPKVLARRATYQSKKMADLSMALPRDRLAGLTGDDGRAAHLSDLGRELRASCASTVALTETLHLKSVDSRAYLAEAREREDEPLLVLET